jgi:putative ABC transport system permease protein
VDTVIQDIKYALRAFGRSPAFTAAVVICLGLGIGVNAAAFSIVEGFLIRALPYDDPAGLLVVEGESPEAEIREGPLVWGDVETLRASGLFSQVGAFLGRDVNLTGGDRPERVQGLAVTPDLFPLLGVAPSLGRTFRAADAAPAGFEQTVLLSDRLWRRSFGADPDVIGGQVQVNGRALTVVGVMPPGFRFPEIHDLWLPLAPADPMDTSVRAFRAVARLADGVTMEAATAGLASLSERLVAELPDSHRRWRFSGEPIRQAYIGAEAPRQFLLMFGAVTLVLLIACANVANLLLARAADREAEVGLRSALGASRRRIVRQLLTESVMLAVAGAVAGIFLALWLVDLVVRSVPATEDLPHWLTIGVDGGVVAYVAALTLGTALIFGLVPALYASRPDLARGFRGAERSVRGGPGRLLEGLVIFEVALALTLLVPAGLLVRSVLALGAADPGFETEHVLTGRLVLSGDRYDAFTARAAFYQGVAERIAGLPGVEAAAWTGAIPADDGGTTLFVSADPGATEARLAVSAIPTTAGYFRTLGLELDEGRAPGADEVRDTAFTGVVVGRRLAGRLWPGGGALGRTLRLENGREFTVIGVAPDLQYEEFGEANAVARLQVHVPYAAAGWRGLALMVRTDAAPARVARGIRAVLREADPALPLFEVMTMDDRLRATRWGQQLMGRLFAVYGAAALILALAGIYGVMAYRVSRRRSEIGVRIALGADSRTVVREVAVRGIKVALVGAAVGGVGAVLAVRAMRGMLYGISETDPLTLASVVLLMLAAAVAAAVLPARAAARLQPAEALRAE